MTYAPGDAVSNYLAPNLDLPKPDKEPELFYEIMNERERKTADVVNVKETAIYQTEEQLTAQTWFAASGDPLSKTRDTFRTVVNFGALPNATTSPGTPHNIPVTSIYSFTKIYAVATKQSATDPTAFSFPIPGFDPSDITKPVNVWVSNENVYIQTTSNLSAYTICYVVLEYLKN